MKTLHCDPDGRGGRGRSRAAEPANQETTYNDVTLTRPRASGRNAKQKRIDTNPGPLPIHHHTRNYYLKTISIISMINPVRKWTNQVPAGDDVVMTSYRPLAANGTWPPGRGGREGEIRDALWERGPSPCKHTNPIIKDPDAMNQFCLVSERRGMRPGCSMDAGGMPEGCLRDA